MKNFQDSKALVREFYDEFEKASPKNAASILSRYTGADYRFRGSHPFNELESVDAVVEALWEPLLGAFTALQRRQDIFMAGANILDEGGEWVTSMGNFMGLFDNDWLGIPSTGKIAFLPYVEFTRVDSGKITESAFFCDILSVMKQVGLDPLPIQTGAEFVHPGPRTHDGLLFDIQDKVETKKSLDLVHRMRAENREWHATRKMPLDHESAPDKDFPPEILANVWKEDMSWYGPSGIGATYTIRRYQEQHQRPFRTGLNDIQLNDHKVRFAEGKYSGWFGWPNITMSPGRAFMGLPASDRRIDMRVVDMYRRDGDKLAENWVFIDVLYWLYQQEVDVLDRTRRILRR